MCRANYEEFMTITTLEMEIQLMKYLNVRQNIIVPNVFWGLGLNYECDLVRLSKNNYATEIEIKTSKQDLLRDKNKRWGHYSKLFKYLYFAVPGELEKIALQEIPERAGLFVFKENDYKHKKIFEVKKPRLNKGCIQWDAKKRLKLAELGTMRILGLKEGIYNQNLSNQDGCKIESDERAKP